MLNHGSGDNNNISDNSSSHSGSYFVECLLGEDGHHRAQLCFPPGEMAAFPQHAGGGNNAAPRGATTGNVTPGHVESMQNTGGAPGAGSAGDGGEGGLWGSLAR